MDKQPPMSNQTAVSRTIAIGDIHGCSVALKTLIEAIQPDPEDAIVTLGDHIDRGPDSRGVIEQLLTLRERRLLVPLMGNHEEMLLAAMEGPSELRYWLKFGGAQVLASYGHAAGREVCPAQLRNIIPREHLEFIKSCRLYHETFSHIFVHANYDPELPMERQYRGTLYWEGLHLERVRPHRSGKTVIVGHTPQQDGHILDLGFLKCIDTGCHLGGWLTALDVSTGKIWQANQQGELRQG